jgi:hypothetical protein
MTLPQLSRFAPVRPTFDHFFQGEAGAALAMVLGQQSLEAELPDYHLGVRGGEGALVVLDPTRTATHPDRHEPAREGGGRSPQGLDLCRTFRQDLDHAQRSARPE